MLVECDGDEYEADTEQKHHYAATNWPTLTQGGLQKPLRVVGAPRLNEILALEQNSDRLDVRNNQFVPINAPYRSSGDDSEWSDPTKARNVQFTVLADKTFTMKPGSVVPIDWAIHKGVKRLNYPSHLSLDESSVRDEFKSQGTLGNPDPFNPGYAEAAPQVGHPYPDAPDETINTTTVTVKNFQADKRLYIYCVSDTPVVLALPDYVDGDGHTGLTGDTFRKSGTPSTGSDNAGYRFNEALRFVGIPVAHAKLNCEVYFTDGL
jgi:hypothetical protein